MENISSSSLLGGEDEDYQMDLPPGFRFHPTDEELISHYLRRKVDDSNFSARAIGEVDLNKSEPWELPSVAKMGEKEWYFFCMRDRKYPTGLRTNRATQAGYWKATGKDKEITRGKSLVGMKKTLVFYIGRAPKGEKSNWVMHEYRLDGQFSPQNLPSSSKNEWVICRVFEKNSGVKKAVPIHGLMIMSPDDDYNPFEFNPSGLPQLVDTSPPPPPPSYGSNADQIQIQNQNKPFEQTGGSDTHVSCFSNPIVNPQPQQPVNNDYHHHNFTTNAQFNNHSNNYNNPPYFSSPNYYFNNQSSQNSHYYSSPAHAAAPPPIGPMMGSNSPQYPFGDYMSERDILTAILNNNNNTATAAATSTASKMTQGTTTTMMSGETKGNLRPTTVSASQDTCLSSEMNNPEISSSSYDHHHHIHLGPLVDDRDGVGGMVDSFWNY